MVTKCPNIPYIYDQSDTRDGRQGVLEGAGGEQHNITEAASNELELGKGG